MDLSIVIVNYRGWADLADCLDSLEPLLNRSDPPRAEVIVVDNASGDDRLAAFSSRYPRIRWIENSGNHGFAHGCNRGAEQAEGDTLLFLNPDARDPGGQVATTWRLLQDHPECDLLSVRQVDGEGRPQKVFDAFPDLLNVLGPVRAVMRRLAPTRYADARHCDDAWRAVDWVSGSALMIRRDAFEALGGWCEDYWMYGEDVDLCRRARDQGRQVAFSAEATLEHRHGGTSRRNLEAAALTRSEVIISRHLYARRHFRGLRGWALQALLMFSRWPSLLLCAGLVLVWPGAPAPVRIRAGMARHLAGYLRGAVTRGEWRSPRVVQRAESSP